MKFKVHPELFEILPDVCFGVVLGYGIDNRTNMPEICTLLDDAEKYLREEMNQKDLKTHKDIVPYREAFIKVGINPNKYTSSIEAMAKRVLNGNKLPSINGVVDLVNALSLKYVLPMGAHDVDALEGDIAVRFATEGDTFMALGSTEEEYVDVRELIYADDKRVRTRRWIWRQSDRGKVTENSSNIFFPIDGFALKNKANVLAAAEQLAFLLEIYFGCRTKKFLVDKDNMVIDI